jgi:hypothetical protein
MENDKDIRIETEEYVVLYDKLKPGTRALGKKDPGHTGSKY